MDVQLTVNSIQKELRYTLLRFLFFFFYISQFVEISCFIANKERKKKQMKTEEKKQREKSHEGSLFLYSLTFSLIELMNLQIPGNPKKPCELCYCIRNMTSCVMQECTLHVDGCRPIYNKGVCCPVRYDCGKLSNAFLMLCNEFGIFFIVVHCCCGCGCSRCVVAIESNQIFINFVFTNYSWLVVLSHSLHMDNFILFFSLFRLQNVQPMTMICH